MTTNYVAYLGYMLRHKWFVFVAACRLGIPLLGLLHDLSKFLPSELIPYARQFYGPKPPVRDATGYYKPTNTGNPAFELAWLHHSRRNRHHWQYWAQTSADGVLTVTEMPDRYRLEMLADWIGAGLAQGKPDTRAWYLANAAKMALHPKTRAAIEYYLGVLPERTIEDWVAAGGDKQELERARLIDSRAQPVFTWPHGPSGQPEAGIWRRA